MAKRTGGFIGQDGINAPDQATGVAGSAGDAQVTVSFTAPSDVGGSAITGYSVQATDGSGTYLSSYDIENASYDDISLDVSGQDSKPSGIAFSNDGTKMFLAGYTNDNVYQYSLSTAFDLSTASYDSSFDISGQETIPLDIVFNADGTKLYVVGLSSDSVQQYSLSTAFDISTASYDSISFSFTGQDANPYGLRFNNDGTKMYMVGTNTDFVFQYSLSTAYNVSTASYDSVALNVDGQDESPNGITFNSDGTKLFMIGIDNDAVFQYSLSTAFDLSTASYDSISFSVDTQDSSNQGLTFSSDGTKLYVVGDASDAIFQYSSGIAGYPTASPVTVTGLTNGTSYTFNVWAINPFGWSSPSDASGSVTPVNPFLGDVAFIMGGLGGYSSIEYVTITSTGNGTSFGDLTSDSLRGGSAASSTRAVVVLGNNTNTINYFSMASAGNASDFGDLSAINQYLGGCSSSTRALFPNSNAANTIEYITIASTGNATGFGNLTVSRGQLTALASPTRGVFAGGLGGSNNILDYVTIASTGNATDFGDMSGATLRGSACSSATRGLVSTFMDGSEVAQSTIEYITIASTGNATDFGDLTTARYSASSTSNSTRGLFAGGKTSYNIIDYVTIATTGNAADFGDLTTGRWGPTATSNCHGGLS